MAVDENGGGNLLLHLIDPTAPIPGVPVEETPVDPDRVIDPDAILGETISEQPLEGGDPASEAGDKGGEEPPPAQE